MKGWLTLAALLSLLIASPISADTQTVHHEMKIILDPERHSIEVSDTITLSERLLTAPGRKLHFLLHGGLQPTSPTIGVKINREEAKAGQFGMDNPWLTLTASEASAGRGKAPSGFASGGGMVAPPIVDGIPIEHYTVSLPPGQRTFVLKYQGEIHHPMEQQGGEYARSFSETPGIIASDGVFLAGTSYWYPWFNDGLLSFTLEVELPEDWKAASQGKRARQVHEGTVTQIRWESPEPQEEIYLIAGPWTEYSRTAGGIQVMAFLRSPDEALANPYLETAAQYLGMYQKLIGAYPYKKFSLVENFWDTGYGMPSFTLLGPRIIRFPFILHSSYPHEILHNWWGNGVYVDYEKGNWSEGLTSYLADHLIAEQGGNAAEYRRAALQKYTDYVSESRDFALTEFRARHSSTTEAVGYGKTLMFFHMLRQRLGDKAFIHGLMRFYHDNRFRRASFDNLRAAFESVSGQKLKAEFSQWITRPGAPALRVSGARAEPLGEGYLLTVLLEQTQPGPAYQLRIPIAVTLEDREQAYQTTIRMNTKHFGLELPVPGRPVRLAVDPEFDLFRRLDRNEIPPAFSLAFGAETVLILLPSDAADPLRKGYQELAESWRKSQSGSVEIKWDREVAELPKDQAVWLFGWENRFLSKIMEGVSGYDVSLTKTGVRIEGDEFGRDRHSVVITTRSTANPDLAMTWVATERVSAMPGLGRKLPHYGQYSYLVFEGDEPGNIAKGQWPVVDSPMSVPITQADGYVVTEMKAKLAPRRPLAELPADH